MRRITALAAIGLAALSLTGCAAIVSAPAGAYNAPSPYQVSLGREWSDMSAAAGATPKTVRLLTIDGPLLNRLYIVGPLKSGEVMFKSNVKEKPSPKIRDGMSATERMEFVTDNLTLAGFQRLETSRPRPAKFSGADAVRFDLTGKTTEGLDLKGTAEVADIDGKFYAIIYLAPAEHYFSANLSEVEKVMESVHAVGKT